MPTDGPGDSTPTQNRRRLEGIRRYVGIVLIVYWIGLFVATHIPLPGLPAKIAESDKVVHLAAYAGLGVLLSLWRTLTRPLSLSAALIVLSVLAAYAACDEWLQQFVNRHADVADWVADVIGAAMGVTIIWVLQKVRPLDAEQPSFSEDT